MHNVPFIKMDTLTIHFDDDTQVEFTNLIAFTSPSWLAAYTTLLLLGGAVAGALIKRC